MESNNTKRCKGDNIRSLEKIFAFNKPQQKFIDAFFKEKKILPELIDFNDITLKQHPALLHKLRKIDERN